MAFKDIFKNIINKAVYALERPGPKIHANIGKSQWANSGQWVGVKSSWCRKIRYNQEKQKLFVQFKSSFIARYPNIPVSLAKQMFLANSQGKFVHKYLYRLPYTDGSVLEEDD